MDNKACMLMLFYTLLVIVLILKHKQILKMDKKNMLFLGLSLSFLLVMPLTNKLKIHEPFVEMQEDQQVDYIRNKDHQDNLLDVIDIHKSDVVCYFSTFQIDSFNSSNGTLRNIKNTLNDNHLKLLPVGNIANNIDFTSYIHQEKGVSLHSYTQLEGFECNKLNLNGMREFSMFWFVKFDFNMNDYTELGTMYNLFEMYSTNIQGMVAMNVKLELRKTDHDTIETFIINYAGLEYKYEFDHASRIANRLDFSNGTHLLTFVKYMQDNKHFLKMTIDEERFLLNPVEIVYDNINYITSANTINLSREKFILNKHAEGSQSNTREYSSLKMNLMAFGIFKKAIHTTTASSNIISRINDNLRQQQTIQLSDIFLNTRLELDKKITESEDYLSKSQCKFNNIICQECENVDWADLSSLASSPSCLNEVKKYCKDIHDNVVTDYTEYQKNICELLHTQTEEYILSNVSSNLIEHTCKTYINHNSNIYKPLRFPGVRTIIPDSVVHNNYNTNSNKDIIPPEYIQQEQYTQISTSNLVSSVPSFDDVSNDILNRSIGNLSHDDIVKLAKAIRNVDATNSNVENTESASSNADTTALQQEADALNTKRYESIMNEYRSVNEEMKEIEADATKEEPGSFFGYFTNLFKFT